MGSGMGTTLLPPASLPALLMDAAPEPVAPDCAAPKWPNLMVNVQFVVFPSLQRLVQVQVTLDRVVLQDVAPAQEEGS